MDYFVHITGSVPRANGPEVVALVQHTAYETALALLRQEIGVVALVGASTNAAAASFDDAVIRAAADYIRDTGAPGIVIRTVRHRTKWMERIDDEVRASLGRLDGHITDEALADDQYTGGAIRAAQARLSHGAVVIGGYRGVNDTADLLLASCPPRPIEEILVKGLTGGLPEDVRDRIDESRGWNSAADCRTVHQNTDCARVAHWAADSIAKRLPTAGAVSGAAPDIAPQGDAKSNGRLAKVWYALKSNQLAAWFGNALRLIGLAQHGSGGN